MGNKTGFLVSWRPLKGGKPFDVVVIAGSAGEAVAAVTPPHPGRFEVTEYEVQMDLHELTAAEAHREMVNELQAIGADFGVLGGEKRTDGLRRILTEQRNTIAKINEICAAYEKNTSFPGCRMDEIRDVLGRRGDAMNEAYGAACAGGTGSLLVHPDGVVEAVDTHAMRAATVTSPLNGDSARLRALAQRYLDLLVKEPSRSEKRRLLTAVHCSLTDTAKTIEQLSDDER